MKRCYEPVLAMHRTVLWSGRCICCGSVGMAFSTIVSEFLVSDFGDVLGAFVLIWCQDGCWILIEQQVWLRTRQFAWVVHISSLDLLSMHSPHLLYRISLLTKHYL